MTPEYLTMMRVVEMSCWPDMLNVEWSMLTSPALILGYKLIRIGSSGFPDIRVLNEHLLEEFADIADWLSQ